MQLLVPVPPVLRKTSLTTSVDKTCYEPVFSPIAHEAKHEVSNVMSDMFAHKRDTL